LYTIRGIERIHQREFWLGETDARPGALFRAALGLVVLADLAGRLADFHTFYTAAGLAHAAPAALRWSLFALTRTPGPTMALYVAGMALALAFALGLFARVAGVLLWVFMLSLFNANPFVCDGGDGVVLALLFWSMFADLGATLGLDVRLGRRPERPRIPAAPIRFLQLQIAYIYLVTFLAKRGPTWRGGEAVALVVSSPDWARGVAPWLAQHPGLCAALTWGTLAVEGAFPLLVFSPWRPRLCRALAIAAGLALHAGIFGSLRIGVFSLVMPASYLLFLTPRPAPPGVPAASGWSRRALLAALGAQLAIVVAAELWIVARNRPAPLLADEMQIVGQHQRWYMFSPDVPRAHLELAMPGTLVDGRAVDLVAAVAPGLGVPRGFAYSRWYKLRQNVMIASPALMLALGRYVCRRWNGEHGGPPLDRFELRGRQVPLSGPAPAFEPLLSQRCSATQP
jgi:hypothetical protein